MGYEINKMMCLSTRHIPEKEAELLNTGGYPVIATNGYAYFLHVDDLADLVESGDVDDLPTVLSLMRVAQEYSCAFLQLDCDGDVHEHLPTWDW